jgi:putative tricarboxylic transport membrane protein
MKAALTARALGVDFKSIRFVGFEGGGEAIRALRGKHINILSGDVAEAQQQIDAGAPIRIIAVLADKRVRRRWRKAITGIVWRAKRPR